MMEIMSERMFKFLELYIAKERTIAVYYEYFNHLGSNPIVQPQ